MGWNREQITCQRSKARWKGYCCVSRRWAGGFPSCGCRLTSHAVFRFADLATFSTGLFEDFLKFILRFVFTANKSQNLSNTTTMNKESTCCFSFRARFYIYRFQQAFKDFCLVRNEIAIKTAVPQFILIKTVCYATRSCAGLDFTEFVLYLLVTSFIEPFPEFVSLLTTGPHQCVHLSFTLSCHRSTTRSIIFVNRCVRPHSCMCVRRQGWRRRSSRLGLLVRSHWLSCFPHQRHHFSCADWYHAILQYEATPTLSAGCWTCMSQA